MYSIPKTILMNEALIERFIKLICANTGLHIRPEDKNNFSKKLWQRIRALRISHPEDYYLLLQSNNWSSSEEWKELVCLLTTGESYFFRDRGQFNLLKTKIIPQIIETKNQQLGNKGNNKKYLRIWSAGCSSGEEPYSLAILANELITDLDNWKILVLGTDINYKAIEKAKKGIYNPWSFRMIDPYWQMQYFQQQQNEWEIDERIRCLVKFQYGNLQSDTFPDYCSEFHDIDLILCRNVFVYFEPKAISQVIKKFYHTLVPGGYLMTAHTELYGQNVGEFKVSVLPESVLYQRSPKKQIETSNSAPYDVTSKANYPQFSNPKDSQPTKLEKATQDPTLAVVPQESKIAKLPCSPSNQAASHLAKSSDNNLKNTPDSAANLASIITELKNQKITVSELIREAEILFLKKAYAEAIRKAEQIIASHPSHFDAYCLLAQVYANLGEHNKAIYYSQQAVEIDSLAVQPYYLLAHIAEEKQDLEKAKLFLKTIIYLAPSSVSAYLELASVYQKEGNTVRAKKMLATAFELLKELPPSTKVEPQSTATVSELLDYVKRML